MALRTSKPAFNLREKVSELDRPVGNHGAQLMRSESPEKSFELVRAGRKNLLINGSCQIAQRDTLSVSNSNASVQYGGPDRWLQYFYTSGEQARYDFKQTSVGDSLSERGFKSAMHLDVTTADTSIAADHSLWTAQRIEGFNCDHLRWGTDHAKDLTLSFWIKSSVAGYYSVVLAIDNNGDNRYITTYQVDKKDTWEYKVIHFPGHKSVNIDHDNSTGLEIKFTWMAGSNRIADPNAWNNQGNKYGATGVDLANIFSSTSNNLYLTGVQLEEGNTATPFQHLSYGEELALCQRYYQMIDGASDLTPFGYGRANGSQTIEAAVPLTVPLRATPALTCTHNTAWGHANANTSTTTPSVGRWTKNATVLHATFGGHSGMTNARVVNVHCGSNSNFIMDSEL
tara:strand:- start:50 stop:1243 length:1194 start_codon:yes stop_codon:yes gene_type:complete